MVEEEVGVVQETRKPRGVWLGSGVAWLGFRPSWSSSSWLLVLLPASLRYLGYLHSLVSSKKPENRVAAASKPI